MERDISVQIHKLNHGYENIHHFFVFSLTLVLDDSIVWRGRGGEWGGLRRVNVQMYTPWNEKHMLDSKLEADNFEDTLMMMMLQFTIVLLKVHAYPDCIVPRYVAPD